MSFATLIKLEKRIYIISSWQTAIFATLKFMIIVKNNWFLVTFFCLCAMFICGFSPVVFGQDTTDIEIAIQTRTDSCHDLIAKSVEKPFLVEKITLNSDIFFSPCEFNYLIGFREGDLINAQILSKACSYLIKKNVFETIVITLKPGVIGGKEVQFNLIGCWMLGTVKIKGIWFGKDIFRYQYQLDQGEPFDINKHRDSVEKIKDYLKVQGFFTPTIHDSLTYDRSYKLVNVSLKINKGHRYTIKSVSVDLATNTDIPHDELGSLKTEILKVLEKHLEGKNYEKNLIDKETGTLKKMLIRRGFLHADISLTEHINHAAKNVCVAFALDLHIKKEFVFFGNNFLNNRQLFDTLDAFGRSIWSIPPSILAQEIETTYKSRGFWNVHVQTKEEQGRVFFVIQEGRRASIKEVVLKNVTHFPVGQLVDQYFSALTTQKFFEEETLNKSIDNLIAFYRDEGFFDVSVFVHDRINLDDCASYRLVISVKEGQRHYIQSVQFDKFQDLFAPNCLTSLIAQGKKPVCSRKIIDEQLAWIYQELSRIGKHGASVKPEFKTDGRAVDIIWHIDTSGAEEYCGKTVLVGSSTVPFEVVMRELYYQEGQPIDKNLLKHTVLKLKALDIFDLTNIFPDQSNELGLERPILLKALQGERFQLCMRAGAGLQQMRWPMALSGLTYKLGGTFIIKNPTNAGDQVRFDFNITRNRRDVVGCYKRPWIFGLPIRTNVQVYANRFNQQGFFCDRQNWYEIYQQGFLLGLNGDYRCLEAAGNIGFEWMRMNITPDHVTYAAAIAQAFNIECCLLSQNIPYIFVEPTIIINYVDNKLNPEAGSFTVLSCKGMAPLTRPCNLYPYLFKFLLEQSFYIPIRSWTLAMRLRAGYIFCPHINQVLLNERFYLGGARSLRSYYTDCTPPLGCFSDNCGKAHYVPQGGRAMVNACFELRIPVIENMQAILLQDLGALGHSQYCDIKPSGILAGTGFGLGYNTPIGPLRFDIAWKWSCKPPFDRSYAWYLSLGQVF